MIDLNSEFGRHVSGRLEKDRIIWMTSVDSDGTPQPRPVWFFWNGEGFLIFSRPDTYKLKHIQRNPEVALHFDSDGKGGDIVVFTGQARVLPGAPAADQVEAFIQKYQEGLKRINMTPEQYANSYSVAILVQPNHLRGH